MPTDEKPQALHLLLIDNNTAFTEAAQSYALMQGWTIQIEIDPGNWRPDQSKPNIVLLDYGLGGGNLDALGIWAKKLKETGLLDATWLLSGAASTERDDFIEQWGLRGFLRKPIDLSHLPTLIKTETPAAAEAAAAASADKAQQSVSEERSFPLDKLANELAPAIDIIDIATLEVKWSNRAAREHPLTPHDRKIMRLLEGELLERELSSEPVGTRPSTVAQRLDWDDQKNAFRYTRLYPLLSERYWLTRDWRGGETIHAADLFDLEQIQGLKDRLNAVAMYLAKRHGITRLRVYKLAELPSCPEYGEDKLSPLVMPLFQRGGGFKPDVDIWLYTGFLMRDNSETKKATALDYVCTPEVVEPGVSERVGCSTIEFGNAGTRAQFPVRDQNKQMKALLVFDRRTDHLDSLDQDDKELAEVALRVAGVFDGPLGEDEVSAMRGLLKDLGDCLRGWLKDDEQECERRWDIQISKVLGQALVEQQRARDADPFDNLSSVCASLMQQWKEPGIAGRVWGLPLGSEQCVPPPRPDPLRSWYLALDLGQERWQAVAGAGPIFDAYHRHGSPLPILPPHAQAFAAQVWTLQPIQDFQAWRKKDNESRGGEPPDAYRFLGMLPDAIGAWLAVPMQLEGSVRALMVVHSSYRYHFSSVRCNLLTDAARRLLPLLAAAVRESQVRGAFTAAVMHEVKNDAAAALLHCDWLEEHLNRHPSLLEGTVAERLTMLRHYLEGLSELGRDFLDVLRPSGDAPGRYQDDTTYELSQSASVQPKDWLDNQLRGWRWIYDDTAVDVDIGIEDGTITLAAPALLRRVARVLLQNAFRHGEGKVKISLGIDKMCNCLDLSITNLAYAAVALGLQGGVSSATAQIGPAPQARARVGLASAVRLARAVGGRLDVRNEPCKRADDDACEDDAMRQVSAKLLWPLASPAPVR